MLVQPLFLVQRSSVILLAFVLMALVVSSCGGSDGSQNSGGDNAAASNPCLRQLSTSLQDQSRVIAKGAAPLQSFVCEYPGGKASIAKLTSQSASDSIDVYKTCLWNDKVAEGGYTDLSDCQKFVKNFLDGTEVWCYSNTDGCVGLSVFTQLDKPGAFSYTSFFAALAGKDAESPQMIARNLYQIIAGDASSMYAKEALAMSVYDAMSKEQKGNGRSYIETNYRSAF